MMFTCLTCGGEFDTPYKKGAKMGWLWLMFIFISMGLGLIAWIALKSNRKDCCPYCKSETFIKTTTYKAIQASKNTKDDISNNYDQVQNIKENLTVEQSAPAKNKYKKILLISGILLIFIVLIGIIGGIEDGSKKTTSADSDKLGLTKLELAVYEAILYDDLCTLVDGGESANWYKDLDIQLPIIVSSNQIQLEYEKNEVSADNKFKDKLVSIQGIVKSVDKSINDEIFISLNGGSNPFILPQANIEKDYSNWVGTLSKKDKIGLVCTVDGMLMGSVILSKCVPLYNWADKTTKSIIDNEQNKGFKSSTDIVKASKMLSSKLNTNSACLKGDSSHKECMQELNEAMKKIINTKKISNTK